VSRERPLCVHDYLNAECDCESAVTYDPSTYSYTLDQNIGFAYSQEEQHEPYPNQPYQVTTQNEYQVSNPPSFSDEQVSSTANEYDDSDSVETVSNFGTSLNYDSDPQGYYSHGDHSLDDFDLRTPSIPLSPRSYPHDEESPTNHYSYATASSSRQAEQAPSPDSDGQFRCRKCHKTFKDKKKLKTHKKYHDKTLKCPVAGCGREFGVKEDLKRHKKEVHDKQRIDCPIRGCGKHYSRRWSVLRHLADKHGSVDTTGFF